MIKVSIINFIPYMKERNRRFQTITNKTPAEAVNTIRNACNDKGKDVAEWTQEIKAHCIIPSSHPFRHLLESKGIPHDNPLWVLGAIAYGTETEWIVIESIKWADNTVSYPEKDHKKYVLAS